MSIRLITLVGFNVTELTLYTLLCDLTLYSEAVTEGWPRVLAKLIRLPTGLPGSLANTYL